MAGQLQFSGSISAGYSLALRPGAPPPMVAGRQHEFPVLESPVLRAPPVIAGTAAMNGSLSVPLFPAAMPPPAASPRVGARGQASPRAPSPRISPRLVQAPRGNRQSVIAPAGKRRGSSIMSYKSDNAATSELITSPSSPLLTTSIPSMPISRASSAPRIAVPSTMYPSSRVNVMSVIPSPRIESQERSLPWMLPSSSATRLDSQPVLHPHRPFHRSDSTPRICVRQNSQCSLQAPPGAHSIQLPGSGTFPLVGSGTFPTVQSVQTLGGFQRMAGSMQIPLDLSSGLSSSRGDSVKAHEKNRQTQVGKPDLELNLSSFLVKPPAPLSTMNSSRRRRSPRHYLRDPEFVKKQYQSYQVDVTEAWNSLQGVSVDDPNAFKCEASGTATSGVPAVSCPLLSIADLVSGRMPTQSSPRSPNCSPTPTTPATSTRDTTAPSTREEDLLSSPSSSRMLKFGSPRGRSPRRKNKSPSRGALPPTGRIIQFPQWAGGYDDINEKYDLMWDERICLCGQNGLNIQASPKMTGMCSVIKAKSRKGKGMRAVKIVPKEHIQYPKLFQSQVIACCDIDHPNICKLLDLYEDNTYVYLVMEHVGGPSLLEKALKDNNFCERDVSYVIKTLLDTVAYLHDQQIMHQNLHPENLRFQQTKGDYSSGLKLLDFGLSVQSTHLRSMIAESGMDDNPPPPPLHSLGCASSRGDCCLPPELRDHKNDTFTFAQMAKCAIEYSAPQARRESLQVKATQAALESSDMWSIGCIMHLLLSGSPPPDAAAGEDYINLPRGLHRSAYNLCAALLHPNAEERPSAASALACEWFPHCRILTHSHRSVATTLRASAVTPATPLPMEVKRELARQYIITRLRKLLLGVAAISMRPCLPVVKDDDKTSADSVIVVPVQASLGLAAKLITAVEAVSDICEATYRALLEYGIPNLVQSSGLLRIDFLFEIMAELEDSRSAALLSSALSKLRNRTPGLSASHFATLILKSVCA